MGISTGPVARVALSTFHEAQLPQMVVPVQPDGVLADGPTVLGYENGLPIRGLVIESVPDGFNCVAADQRVEGPRALGEEDT